MWKALDWLQEVWGDLIGAGLFAYLTWHVSMFWLYGGVYTYEHNVVIRIIETILFPAGVLLYLGRLWGDARKPPSVNCPHCGKPL
jgi:hypothetical protein